jgi:hypothetical protein
MNGVSLMVSEQEIYELSTSDPRAAEWLEVIAELAGTYDADWAVLEWTSKLLSFFVPKDIQPSKAIAIMRQADVPTT